MPVMPGMPRSVMTTSTGSRAKSSSASRAEAAVMTVWPPSVSIARMTSSTSGSSSTARMRMGSSVGRKAGVRAPSAPRAGNDSVKVVPAPSRLCHGDRAAIAVHDLLRQAQPEAGAALAGPRGEERLEGQPLHLGAHAASGVGDRDDGALAVAAHVQREPAAARTWRPARSRGCSAAPRGSRWPRPGSAAPGSALRSMS